MCSRKWTADILWLGLCSCANVFPSSEHMIRCELCWHSSLFQSINGPPVPPPSPPLTSLSLTHRWCCWGQIYWSRLRISWLATKTSDQNQNKLAIDFSHKCSKLTLQICTEKRQMQVVVDFKHLGSFIASLICPDMHCSDLSDPDLLRHSLPYFSSVFLDCISLILHHLPHSARHSLVILQKWLCGQRSLIS